MFLPARSCPVKSVPAHPRIEIPVCALRKGLLGYLEAAPKLSN